MGDAESSGLQELQELDHRIRDAMLTQPVPHVSPPISMDKFSLTFSEA